MKCTIEIQMDNAAFDDAGNGDSGFELTRIFGELAKFVRCGCKVGDEKLIVDSSGNHIGQLTITGE